MKTTRKKRGIEINPEEAMKQIQRIFKERGSKALEMARKEVLKEKIECKEAREALTYFMTEYWHDLARPTLLSLACEAVGGDPELTTPIAVPMILISGAIDMHDDIIDKSKIKNEHQTVYGKFGPDLALIVGDILLGKGLILLNEAIEKGIHPEKMVVISNIVKTAFLELGDAEALELRFRGRLNVTPEEYLHVVRKKAADVEAHTRISAIIGNATEKQIDALGKYGRILGMLLILRDDLLDTLDFDEMRNRIKRECLPLPLLYALANSEIKPMVNSILLKQRISKRDAEKVFEIIQKTNGIKLHRELMNKIAKNSHLTLEKVKHRTLLQLLIQALVPYFV